MISGKTLIEQLNKRGFYFHKDIIFNYYVSLKTKPFVILTGISGSGKSKIAEIFAEIIDGDNNESCAMVPVKPNWRDSKGLFGYHNVIDDSYYMTPAIKLFIDALKNPSQPHFLILDEMNIAKVEHYFADYLSLIESRRYSAGEGEVDFSSFEFNEKVTLSEAIILSAIDIDKKDEYLKIEDYRNNRFSIKWKEQLYGGNNWTAQYRTELNQGDNRVASRIFENNGQSGMYRLKDKSLLNPADLELVEKLEKLHTEAISSRRKSVIQDNMVLHNSNVCLGTVSGNKCSCTECPYANNEKYLCSNLISESGYLVPPELPIPLNVYTIGTVNVDETTYMFSPKVLDRSNVIEFNEVDFPRVYNIPDNIRRFIAYSRVFDMNEYYFSDETDIAKELRIALPSVGHVNDFINGFPVEYTDLIKIFNILKKYNSHFGYRVMNEISCYVMNAVKLSNNTNNAVHALDLQILQKILPKMHGSYEKLWNPLIEMLKVCSKEIDTFANITSISDILAVFSGDNGNIQDISDVSSEIISSMFKYPKTANKLIEFLSDLETQGFATFIR